MCGAFFNVFNVLTLADGLCLDCIPHLVLVQVSGDTD
jgi:hypothetical protein